MLCCRESLKYWIVAISMALGMGVNPCAAQQLTLRVDQNVQNPGFGFTWQGALKYLQEALDKARNDPMITQILVAQGTYRPDRDSTFPMGTGDRSALFDLTNGVAVRGGYRGNDGSGLPPQDREIELYETILSGDLLENDSDPGGDNGDNSYHVVVTESSIDDTRQA